jgi:hypothetical protein
MHTRKTILSLIATTLMLAIPAVSLADDTRAEIESLKQQIRALESRIDQGESKTDSLVDEIANTKLSRAIPLKKELKAQYGMGPAASGVYQTDQGLSIGGYGEANYRAFVDDKGSNRNQADLLRLVGYFGYKFSDWIVFNSEIELEHANTSEMGGVSGSSEGKVSAEFAYLDFFLDPAVNVRLGNVLVPMGFINEIHEPPFFHGVLRPEVERVIIPATWNENGIGLFGSISDELQYRTFVVGGLRASRFGANGIREGRQRGNRSIMEDIAWVGRLDYAPEAITGLTTGLAYYIGDAGQDDELAVALPNVRTTLLEAHAQYRFKQLELRALGAWGSVSNAGQLSTALEETVGSRQNGWYLEAAYNILPWFAPDSTQYVAPFFRLEKYDTHASVPTGFSRNANLDTTLYTGGLTYKPYSQVALKLDYRNYELGGSANKADEVAFGVGFAF